MSDFMPATIVVVNEPIVVVDETVVVSVACVHDLDFRFSHRRWRRLRFDRQCPPVSLRMSDTNRVIVDV